MKINRRNGNIEVLRFFMCLVIMLFHAGFSHFPVRGGYLAVEFFFLITGVFTAKGLRKERDLHRAERMEETLKASCTNLKKRFGAIFPYFLLANIIGVLLHIFSGEESQIRILLKCVYIPFDCFFLSLFGFPIAGVTGVAWYLSALFLALWCLYPIARRWYAGLVYIAPVLGAIVIGAFGRYFGNLDIVDDLVGVIPGGFLRAVVMISLGMFVYEVSLALQNIEMSLWGKRGLTLIEVVFWLAVFLGMIVWQAELAPGLDMLVVFCMLGGMAITISEKSLLHGRFEQRGVIFCGRLSLVLFMNHIAWLKYWPEIMRFTGLRALDGVTAASMILIIFVTSLGILAGGDALRKGTVQLARLIAHKNNG